LFVFALRNKNIGTTVGVCPWKCNFKICWLTVL